MVAARAADRAAGRAAAAARAAAHAAAHAVAASRGGTLQAVLRVRLLAGSVRRECIYACVNGVVALRVAPPEAGWHEPPVHRRSGVGPRDARRMSEDVKSL